MKNQKHQNASARTGTFETPGGRTYLENLQRLQPTELTKRAIERVQKDDRERNDEPK